jgi:hypothetical protein
MPQAVLPVIASPRASGERSARATPEPGEGHRSSECSQAFGLTGHPSPASFRSAPSPRLRGARDKNDPLPNPPPQGGSKLVR